MLQAVNQIVSNRAASLVEAPEAGRFNWLAALTRELTLQGISAGRPRQKTPLNAHVGYVQDIEFEGKKMTMTSVIGEDNRFVLRLSVFDTENEHVLSYVVRLTEGGDINDIGYVELEDALRRRSASFGTFATQLVCKIESDCLVH